LNQVTTFLGHLDAAGLAFIGVLAIVNWVRRRGSTRACLAAALGLLGFVSAIGQLSALHPLPWFVSILNLVCFMASGYALVELRHRLIPLRRRVRPLLLLLITVTTALAVPVTISSDPAHPSRFGWLIGSALILEWAGCIATPAVRFLLESRGLPVVQRKRLRALSGGYLGMAIVLVIALGAAVGAAAVSAQPNPVVGLAFQIAATAVIPLLYVGFAPPVWLRRSWRETEADAYRRGNEALMTFTTDLPSMGGRAVEWAMRFVGARAGLMLATDGRVLVSRGLTAGEAEELAERTRASSQSDDESLGEQIAMIPVPTSEGVALLVVVAGPFTPFFGTDEILTLKGYANSLAVAMDRVHLSASLRHQSQRMESLLQAVSQLGAGLVITEDGQLSYANKAYLEMTGFELDELKGQLFVDLVPEEERAELVERMDAQGSASQPPRHQTRMARKNGIPLEVETVFHGLADEGEHKLIALVQDISARKRAERALAETARLDPLTAVPNRRAWQEQLAKSLERAANDNQPLCVAILDLDNFKEFNDDWGHQRGDRLLIDVARAWKGALRDGDFLSRYGGDEFAVMMPGCSIAQAETVLQRVVNASPEETSIGLAAWDGTETADELVARADGALLQSKRNRRGGITVADAPRGGDRFVSWSVRLEEVLDRRYLTAAYQPIADLDRDSLLGYEALLRIAGSPAESSVEELFTAAQRLGYSRALDWLGRRTALECSGGLPAGSQLFVNVSARALLDPVHCSDQMLMLLRWAQRDPEEIVFEISEREMISNLTRFCEVLAEYRGHGFRFALDDVGEGHSTLEVLAAANAEFIKIARSLTESVHMPGPQSAVRAIITFAESSGATVIAEGISDASMGERMQALGVRFGQGYALGRPQYFPTHAETALVLKAV
jgi:diguanylate cyclase (GGDEF)-like protein/PAS domain S-box-containing protein